MVAILVALTLACWMPSRLPLSEDTRTRVAVATRAQGARMAFCRYVRASDGGETVDLKQVEKLLTEREGLRRDRRFREADEIRDILIQAHNVYVWDKDWTWSYGDRPPPRAPKARVPNNFYRASQRLSMRRGDHADRRPPRPQTSRVRVFNEWGHDYDRHPDDTASLDGAALLSINQLLQQRLEAKFSRNYDLADELLAELGVSRGVTVNDGMKLWRADGKSFERLYRRAGSMTEAVDGEAVQKLIRERTEARRARDYSSADAILALLLDEHGVVISDDTFEWRFVGSGHDGLYGEGGVYGRRSGQSADTQHDYHRDEQDMAPLPPALLNQIDELLSRRLTHKKARQFDEADSLQQELYELGVAVDDRARVWYMMA